MNILLFITESDSDTNTQASQLAIALHDNGHDVGLESNYIDSYSSRIDLIKTCKFVVGLFGDFDHLYLRDWADIILIAPADMNTLAKIAHGFADTTMLKTIRTLKKPVWVVPSMDCESWNHPLTQQHFQLIQNQNINTIAPDKKGRMPQNDVILSQIGALERKLTMFDEHTLRRKLKVGVQKFTDMIRRGRVIKQYDEEGNPIYSVAP